MVVSFTWIVAGNDGILRRGTSEVSVTCGKIGLLSHPDFFKVIHSFLVLKIYDDVPFFSWPWLACWFFRELKVPYRLAKLMWEVFWILLLLPWDAYVSRTLPFFSFPVPTYHCPHRLSLDRAVNCGCFYSELKVFVILQGLSIANIISHRWFPPLIIRPLMEGS